MKLSYRAQKLWRKVSDPTKFYIWDGPNTPKAMAELEAAIAEFEKLGARKFGEGDGIAVGALVELEHGGESSLYFVGPRAGGTEVLHDRKEILVITPQSPLGVQLMGKKSGDQPQLTFGSTKQAAKILRVE